MKEEVRVLIKYRLERSREALEEARMLLEEGHTNTYINRLYYACFYAVSALLLMKELSSAKHSGVRALFHQKFVKPGLVAIELGQLYDRLYDNRQKADYADLVRFDIEEVRNWYGEAERFLDEIEKIIKEEITPV
jgi:hypothetical protein